MANLSSILSILSCNNSSLDAIIAPHLQQRNMNLPSRDDTAIKSFSSVPHFGHLGVTPMFYSLFTLSDKERGCLGFRGLPLPTYQPGTKRCPVSDSASCKAACRALSSVWSSIIAVVSFSLFNGLANASTAAAFE